MPTFRPLAALAAAALLAVTAMVSAQSVPPPNTPPPAGIAQAPMSQDLLDSLLAPIALYPDQLLAQVLMAATYPLEVVQAARFVRDNPSLRGAALDDALKDKPWDPSVLSLASFPQVLDMMNEKLEWTQRLGDAFLADEGAVMQTVQGLRARAQQAGNLQSTEQQQVIYQDRTIIIQPTQPQVLFVPVYNPTVIFGPWWAPAYRPWYWFPPPIWGYPPRPPNWGFYSGFYWGSGWGISHNNWGWAQPNWRGNTININVNNNNVWVNRPAYRDRVNNGNWTHNVDHRQGVAYRDNATSNRYRPNNPASVQSRENFRGRDNPTRPVTGDTGRPVTGGNTTRPAPGTSGRPDSGSGGNFTRPAPGTGDRGGSGSNFTRPGTPTPPTARPASQPPRAQPAFQPESRPQVQRDANRGAQSRASPQRPPQSQQREAPGGGNRESPNAHRGGEGGGGQGRGR